MRATTGRFPKTTTITRSTFTGNDIGITQAWFRCNLTVDRTTFADNVVGVWVDEACATITDSDFLRNTAGLRVNSGNATVERSRFVDNTNGMRTLDIGGIDATDVKITGGEVGISLFDNAGVTLRSSVVTGAGIGVLLQRGAPATIDANTFRANGVAIVQLDDPNGDVVITNNTLRLNGEGIVMLTADVARVRPDRRQRRPPQHRLGHLRARRARPRRERRPQQRQRAAVRRGGVHPGVVTPAVRREPRARFRYAGGMFWLSRKVLSGSQADFSLLETRVRGVSVGPVHARGTLDPERVDVHADAPRRDRRGEPPARRGVALVVGRVLPLGADVVLEPRAAVRERRRPRVDVRDGAAVRDEARRPHVRLGVGEERLERRVGQLPDVVALGVAPEAVRRADVGLPLQVEVADRRDASGQGGRRGRRAARPAVRRRPAGRPRRTRA